MLKKSLALSFLFASLPLHAAELTTYNAIEDSLMQGHLITMVVKASACEIINPNPKPIKTSAVIFRPHTVLISEVDGDMAATGSWFTTNLPSSTGNGVDQRYKVILDNHNQAKMTWEFFNADTGQKSSIQTIEAKCELGKGMRVYES